MTIYYFFCGAIVGLVFSATTVAATVWCVQLAVWRGWGTAKAAVGAIAFGQLIWALLAAVAVGDLAEFYTHQWRYAGTLVSWTRAFCSIIFIYMAFKTLNATPMAALTAPSGPVQRGWQLTKVTLAVTLSMPMRFFGYVGMFLTFGTMRYFATPGPLLAMVLGVGVGSLLWFCVIAGVAAHVGNFGQGNWWPEIIRRQVRVSAIVYLALAVFALIPVALAVR